MIVPQYWAEGHAQNRTQKRRLTIRRFGWSDTSQEDAQRQADTRAAAAQQSTKPRPPVLETRR